MPNNNTLQVQSSEFVEKKKQESGNITYIYDEKHITARNKKKVATLKRLGKSIEKLRRQVSEDLDSPEKGEAAMVVALIDETYERVGNPGSAKESHFGVTTWRKKHVSFPGSKAVIKYKGKGGIDQTKTVTSKRIVGLLKGLTSAIKADDELFPSLSSSMVNSYLKPFKITAKDIRGFHANEEMKKALKKTKKKGGDEKQRKEDFKKALEETARNVGHDPGTLKKDYLVPLFEENYLERGKIGVSSNVSDGVMGISRVAGHLDRMMAIRKVAKKDKKKQWETDSAMLALMAPPGIVRKLRKFVDADTVSPDGLHMTLLFLGKVADLDDATMKAIQRAAEKVCARHQPLAMRVSGVGMFSPGEDGTPVYIVPNAKGLSALQADLENVVGSIIDLPSEHGWVPHMTVAYSCDDKPSPPELKNYPEWTAKAVRFQAGGKAVADFLLGRQKKAEAEFPLSRRAAEKQMAMDIFPIASDPVLWSDEQLVEVVKTPHLMEQLEKKPELLKVVLEQIAKRKGAQKGLEPKDIGKWMEHGWFLLYVPKTPLGFFRNRHEAAMAADRLVAEFAEGSLDWPCPKGGGIHQDSAFIDFMGEMGDLFRDALPDEFPVEGPGEEEAASVAAFHTLRREENANEKLDELMRHPFYAEKRERYARKALKISKAPQGFTPSKEAVVTEGRPTMDNMGKAEKEAWNSKGFDEVWPADPGDESKEFVEDSANAVIRRRKMRQKGLDPDKMADDMSRAAGFIGRMIRMAERLDDFGDREGAERLCRQMDLLIRRRAHFVPSDKTKAPPMWRKNLDYGEESPYYGSVKEFMKKYPGGLGDYIKKRRKSRKKRERQWKLAQIAGNKLMSARMRNAIDADMADLLPGTQCRMDEVWKIAQQTEDEEALQDAKDNDYIKDPMKAPREFVKYWSLLLKKVRGKRKKRKGK